MEHKGQRKILASRDVVWAALNSPEMLQHCIPTCRSVTGDATTGYSVTVAPKLGPIAAKLSAHLAVQDIVPAHSMTIAAYRGATTIGKPKGTLQVVLADLPKGTQITYTATAASGGKFSFISSGVVDKMLPQVADQFFTRLKKAVEAAQNPAQGTMV